MTTEAELDAAEINIQVQVGALERAGAARELADLGISASPADIEQWISWTPKQRREASLAWITLNASYT
jgi:hypothetical protein